MAHDPSAAKLVGIPAESSPVPHQGSRLIPAVIDADEAMGIEPGGGVRLIASGVRVVAEPNGALRAADDRLPKPPDSAVELPERLGGGHLFVLGEVVWRSDSWLGRAHPVFRARRKVKTVMVGLDRVYLGLDGGATLAIDAKSGEPLDRGGFPRAPYVTSFAAIDGWHAAAISDWLGLIVTKDAGASWEPRDLPSYDKDIAIEDGELVLVPQGTDDAGDRVSVATGGPIGEGAHESGALTSTLDKRAKMFGPHPLKAALEAGWPLGDGTAAVARDGTLAKIRLADGAVVAVAEEAFDMRSARCDPVRMGADPRGFGFICGEPRGRTAVYRYESSGQLTLVRAFATPRRVLSGDNGALVVAGGCQSDGADPRSGSDPEERLCLVAPSGAIREVRLRGALDGARVILLASNRLAVLSPPHGELEATTLTVLDGDRPSTIKLKFDEIARDALRVLEKGLWLDGLEERSPGTIAGWVEHGGAVVGYRITPAGKVTTGSVIRDSSVPVVSGRFGLAWTSSGRGFETTDGGNSWKTVDLPEPIEHGRAGRVRSCSRVGCIQAGWLRVGWGKERKVSAVAPKEQKPAPHRATPRITLRCSETKRKVPAATPEPSHTRRHAPHPTRSAMHVLGTGSPFVAAPMQRDWTPFFDVEPPPVDPNDMATSLSITDWLALGGRLGQIGRLYAWSAADADLSQGAHALIRWIDPFGGPWPVHSSQAGPPPDAMADALKFATPTALRTLGSVSTAVSDDGTHALAILGARSAQPVSLVAYEAQRAPEPVRWAGAEPLAHVMAATFAAGRWFVLGTAARDESQGAARLVKIEGGSADDVIALPRHRGVSSQVSLAADDDGRHIGVLVTGAPNADRSLAERWLLEVDVRGRRIRDVLRVADYDFADRAPITACKRGAGGWSAVVPWPGQIAVRGGDGSTSLSSPIARVRIKPNGICLDAVAARQSLASAHERGAPQGNDRVSVTTYSGSAAALASCSVE